MGHLRTGSLHRRGEHSARDAYQRAVELFSHMGYADRLVATLGRLGDREVDAGDQDAAVDAFRRAFALAETIDRSPADQLRAKLRQ